MENPGAIFAPHRESDRVAVVDLTGGGMREVRYRELAAGCEAVARGLRRAGLGAGARIGILSGNAIAFYETFFGAMLAGAIALPFNLRLADDALAALVAHNDVDLLFVDAPNAGRLPAGAAKRMVVFGAAGPAGYEAFVDRGPFDAVAVPDDAPLLQPFTSGTTGLPKGIVLSAGAVRWAMRQMLPAGRAPDPTTVVSVAHPLYHKNAMLGSKGAFLNGGRVVMMERFDPERFVDAIGRHGITKVHTVPTMMARIMAQPDLVARIDQSSIREVHMGSAPVSERLFEEIRAAFPKANVRISYGVTEAGPMQFGEHPSAKKRPPRSIGYPLPEVQVRLVGGASPDEGVLLIKNAGVMRGYYKAPEQSAARFDAEGWYVTGDILRRDAEGFFYFVGRDDDMMVVNGTNLYPATVEETLLRHPGIAAAAVVAVNDDVRGHVPVAFVVARPGVALDPAEIQAHCLARAPAYQHPRLVRVVEELPLAGTNKVDVRRLRAIAGEAWAAAHATGRG
ncbi:MAG: acyl--CoA ligase [Alphaproteobacteria bacterium]|nr:acyl--CoA ligase [Alphaproteobacteria bacterium]